LVIQNNVGGWVEFTEFALKLGPGQVVDLDFYLSKQLQETSKELKRAISRRFVTVVKSQGGPRRHFHIGGAEPAIPHLDVKALRKALFLKTDIPVNPAYDLFVMRDPQSKLAMVRLANDVKLLNTVIRREQDAGVVRAAHAKLQELVG